MRWVWITYFGAIAVVVLLVLGYIVLDKIRDRLDPGRAARLAELQRLNGELQELERQLAENKKILSEGMTEDQVRKMAAAGQFPTDQVGAYLEARKSVDVYVSRALPAMIADKKAEIEACRRGE